MQGLEHMARSLNDLAAEMKTIREEVNANLKQQIADIKN
jgi:flagellar hook-associated protein FlgK